MRWIRAIRPTKQLDFYGPTFDSVEDAAAWLTEQPAGEILDCVLHLSTVEVQPRATVELVGLPSSVGAGQRMVDAMVDMVGGSETDPPAPDKPKRRRRRRKTADEKIAIAAGDLTEADWRTRVDAEDAPEPEPPTHGRVDADGTMTDMVGAPEPTPEPTPEPAPDPETTPELEPEDDDAADDAPIEGFEIGDQSTSVEVDGCDIVVHTVDGSYAKRVAKPETAAYIAEKIRECANGVNPGEFDRYIAKMTAV